ncbi:GNAT family N-acetyltransferase [Pseudotenacibaculum sp. MALMAid0570]|uniref:GNAT family N-acetyltransferase n=1 Tax=Pseudotenacibaculum sp. MALMAid0570 TaxID=3143938 RepID=UPI0032E0437E
MDKKLTKDKQTISKELQLQRILEKDHENLYALMKRIYPPAYINYWQDNGDWYVNDLYNINNLKKELKEENTDYFFVLLNNQCIGIMRIVWNLDTHYLNDKNYVKLHRLYLDQTIQNKGIGYQLMSWLINKAKQEGYKKLWLEVMEKQSQALYFYQKLGFKEVDKVFIDFPLVYNEYRGMYKMVKILT